MCLTKTTITIYKQRIIHFTWIFSYSKRCCLCKSITFTYYKIFKNIIRI